MKIEINQVAEVANRIDIKGDKLRELIEELHALAEAEAQAEDEKAPPVKKQFVVLVSDPDERFPKHDFAAWVLQIPENESVATTQARVFRAACDFNATKKGRLLPVKTVGEALECIPSKHLKDAEVWVKTKTPVLVLTTDNWIPQEEKLGL